MEAPADNQAPHEQKMPRHKRYYALHREERIAKYNSRPDIIAKREEREKRRIEKEAEQAAKKEAAEVRRQERLKLALATRQPHTLPA